MVHTIHGLHGHDHKVAGNGILPGLHVELGFSSEIVEVMQQNPF
jgi:hypothetical protein